MYMTYSSVLLVISFFSSLSYYAINVIIIAYQDANIIYLLTLLVVFLAK